MDAIQNVAHFCCTFLKTLFWHMELTKGVLGQKSLICSIYEQKCIIWRFQHSGKCKSMMDLFGFQYEKKHNFDSVWHHPMVTRSRFIGSVVQEWAIKYHHFLTPKVTVFLFLNELRCGCTAEIGQIHSCQPWEKEMREKNRVTYCLPVMAEKCLLKHD